MNEGGQSSTGQVRAVFTDPPLRTAEKIYQLIDFILTTHPAYGKLKAKVAEENSNIHQGMCTSVHL